MTFMPFIQSDYSTETNPCLCDFMSTRYGMDPYWNKLRLTTLATLLCRQKSFLTKRFIPIPANVTV